MLALCRLCVEPADPEIHVEAWRHDLIALAGKGLLKTVTIKHLFLNRGTIILNLCTSKHYNNSTTDKCNERHTHPAGHQKETTNYYSDFDRGIVQVILYQYKYQLRMLSAVVSV